MRKLHLFAPMRMVLYLFLLLPTMAGSIANTHDAVAAPRSSETAVAQADDDVIPLEGIRQVSAGYAHTCAVTIEGGVKCWGDNSYGQLGNGGEILWDQPSEPVDVHGLDHGIVMLATGWHHTCALTDQGGIKCWGANNGGQLGDGTGTERPTPVDVIELDGKATSVVAELFYTCAVMEDGGAKCWGQGRSGTLGIGTDTSESLTPQNVIGLSGPVIAIAPGDYHNCALIANGDVQCWGENGSGELGDGGVAEYFSLTPVTVLLEDDAVAIASGEVHSCAQLAQGGVQCWGSNQYGQLGNPDISDHSFIPVDVTSLEGETQAIINGTSVSCALNDAGDVQCWGNNLAGQIGNGSIGTEMTPVSVKNLDEGVIQVDAGYVHTCAVTSEARVKCWGDDSAGQLGDGTIYGNYAFQMTPVDVIGLEEDVVALEAGGEHTCSRTAAGAMQCWGENRFGQLGDNSYYFSASPVDVIGLADGVLEMAMGGTHSCAITPERRVKCWGENGSSGKLGNHGNESNWMGFSPSPQPVDVLDLENAAALSAGEDHTCAVTTDGAVRCWGQMKYGWPGDSPYELDPGVRAVATGNAFSCVITAQGGVQCWGANGSYQLGNGTRESSATPVDVIGLSSGIQAITASTNHTCALTDEGGVKCWGWDSDGALGNGSTAANGAPVDVVGLERGVTAIVAGGQGEGTGSFTCALTEQGGVKCWGYGGFGALGNGSNETARTPVDVVGLGSDVTAIAAGDYHACALSEDGAKCWGSTHFGQLGNGEMAHHLTPSYVGYARIVAPDLPPRAYLPLVQSHSRPAR